MPHTLAFNIAVLHFIMFLRRTRALHMFGSANHHGLFHVKSPEILVMDLFSIFLSNSFLYNVKMIFKPSLAHIFYSGAF